MSTKTTNTLLLILIVLGFAIGVFVYPSLPERIVSHWNIQGQADGTTAKFWAVFLFPLIMLLVFILSRVIPRLDPLRENIEQFKTYYTSFWLVIEGFFFYLFLLMLGWNMGYRFNFVVCLVPAFAVLWFFIGVLLEHTKRNWFMGIRTPWTLSSDTIWEKTNKLGGKLFKAAGVLALLGLVIQNPVFIFILIIGSVLVVVFTTIIYSYLEYKKSVINQ